MGIELVHNENPFPWGVGGDRIFDMSHKVFFGACWAQGRRRALAGRHLEIGDQGQGPMALVFKFASLDLPWPHRSRGVDTFQSLDACFLVCTQQMNPLLMQLRSLGIQVADCLYRLVKLFGVLPPLVV